jgi:hypothetical protein
MFFLFFTYICITVLLPRVSKPNLQIMKSLINEDQQPTKIKDPERTLVQDLNQIYKSIMSLFILPIIL